jgi:hypothetical protein
MLATTTQWHYPRIGEVTLTLSDSWGRNAVFVTVDINGCDEPAAQDALARAYTALGARLRELADICDLRAKNLTTQQGT